MLTANIRVHNIKLFSNCVTQYVRAIQAIQRRFRRQSGYPIYPQWDISESVYNKIMKLQYTSWELGYDSPLFFDEKSLNLK